MRTAAVVIVALLLVGGLTAWWWVSRAPSSSWTPSPAGGAMLQIHSKPEGARVSIDGRERGVTPWFGDNDLTPVAHVVELTLPGYEKGVTTVFGGEVTKVEVALVRLQPRAKVVADGGVVVDAGVKDAEPERIAEDPEAERHTKGPLRPPPAPFVDSDLEKEAKQPK